MWKTNAKVLVVVLGTIAAYTWVANAIPQVESEVPEEISFEGGVTPEALVSAGERLFTGAGGCTACHGLGTRAPNLREGEAGTGPIGARCGERVEGESCKEYLHASLVDPRGYVVEGYNPIMPDVSRTLSSRQVWALVAYLESLGGEVTVTAGDVGSGGVGSGGSGEGAGTTAAAGAGGAPGAGAGGAGIASGSTDPVTVLREATCLTCHRLDGEGAPIGPSFDGIGARLSPDEIRRSILRPSADTAEGYAQVAGTMPPNFGDRLTAAQLEAVVDFLAGRTGGGE